MQDVFSFVGQLLINIKQLQICELEEEKCCFCVLAMEK